MTEEDSSLLTQALKIAMKGEPISKDLHLKMKASENWEVLLRPINIYQLPDNHNYQKRRKKLIGKALYHPSKPKMDGECAAAGAVFRKFSWSQCQDSGGSEDDIKTQTV
jgi:hypothetical protein